jgi:hypothetical protein
MKTSQKNYLAEIEIEKIDLIKTDTKLLDHFIQYRATVDIGITMSEGLPFLGKFGLRLGIQFLPSTVPQHPFLQCPVRSETTPLLSEALVCILPYR